MAPRKSSTARRPLTPWPVSTPTIRPFAKTLGSEPFLGNPSFVLAQNQQVNEDRFEGLLAGIQALSGFKEPEKPEWDPPENEDKTTDLDVARMLLLLDADPGNREANDWDEARVWREMYEREYAISDKLRQIAQNLDDKLDEGIVNVEEHNAELDHLADVARRLQLDLGL